MPNVDITLVNYQDADPDYNHIQYFKNLTDAQLNNYFCLYKFKTIENCSYQRKDGYIRLPIDFDEAIKYNYCFYKNEAESITYYCFIKDIKYISDDRCDIYLETDVFTTWRNKYNILDSFIEREHVDDDSIGVHTIPESLELGEYVSNNTYKDDNLQMDLTQIIVGTTSTVSQDEALSDIGGIYGGVYSGVKYRAMPIQYDEDGSISNMPINVWLQDLTDAGAEDSIVSIFMAPIFLRPFSIENDRKVDFYTKPKSYTFTFKKPTTIDGYTPKNNKLFTYPYRYLLVSNGNGASALYHYELFDFDNSDDYLNFIVKGVLTPGCSIRMYPAVYKGTQTPENEGLNLGKYPICNWANDQYTNWITQNSVNIATTWVSGITGTIGGAVGGFMAGNVPGAIIGGVGGAIAGGSQIARVMNEKSNAERIPPQSKGNINCGDVVASNNDNTFTYYNMSIRKEYAKMIDDYFTAYGYQVNRFGVPLENHRSSFWYTKTIDVGIESKQSSAIPISDLKKIKEAYNKGITFWNHQVYIRDYSQDNDIK